MPPPPTMTRFAASLEGLLILAIFVALSALSNWIKKRAGQAEEGADEEPRPTPSPPARRSRTIVLTPEAGPRQKPVDWQEELRRLLAGETEAPAPPPPISARPPRPAGTPPPLRPPPATVTRPATIEDRDSAESLASLTESEAAYQKASEVDETVSRHLEQRASLAESTSVYQQASQLDLKVAGHLRDVTSRPVQLTSATRHRFESPEIAQTRALFRQPATARRALIASVILGPPVGLRD